MHDLLEPARELSLKSQEHEVDLISMVDVIESTDKKYQRLLKKVSDDPDVIFKFPKLSEIMSKIETSNFFGTNNECPTTYKYQDIVLKNFSQQKSRLPNVAKSILTAICNTFQERFGLLTDSDKEIDPDITIHGDKILTNICNTLNTKAWVMPPGDTQDVTAIFKNKIESIQYLFTHFKDIGPLKNVTKFELEQQYVDLIEYAKKYYDISKYKPIDLWLLLYVNSDKSRFESVFLLAELCLCAPYSNAAVERGFNYCI